MENKKYPAITINREALYFNTKKLVDWCNEHGIMIAGVIKGFNAIPAACEEEARGGVKMLASSRIEHLKSVKEMALKTVDGVDMPTLLIRIPMLSEIEETVKYADYSLNSEMATLDALNEEAKRQNKIHKVILMTDLGDLREGWFYEEDLLAAALHAENDLENIELAGIGTNLGCVGSITPTGEKMEMLAARAETVEKAIGRELEIVSGGASSSLAPMFDGVMPSKVNMLRIGAGIPIGSNDQIEYIYHIDETKELRGDCITLEAQVVEMNIKPTYPIGEIGCNAFGQQIEYEDRGNRKRAILGVGSADYGDFCDIIPQLEGAFVWGASSDHTILDIEDVKQDIKVGDIVKFELRYTAVLNLTANNTVKQYVE